MKNFPVHITLLFVLSSCNWLNNSATNNEDTLYSLYRQRIDSSKSVFYEFAYSGAFVTSSDYTGITILDSTETFQRNKIDELPSSLFAKRPTKDILNLIKIKYGPNPTKPQDTLLTPIDQYEKDYNGKTFNTVEYQITYGSATKHTGLMRYEFDRLIETNDSLTFFGVSKKFGGKHFDTITSFEKGNIKLVEAGDSISYIQINEPIIGYGSIYKPTAPLELVSNQPIVGVATYEFYPKKKLNSNLVSDYGVWKKVK